MGKTGTSSSRLKRRSTSSTYVGAAHVVNEATDPLQKDTELDDLETEINRKKLKKYQKEIQISDIKGREVYGCNFANKDVKGDNDDTIFVSGFDTSLSRDEIKSSLTKHFSSCGEISRVFVPIECKTGVSIGYAFINLKSGDESDALALSGSVLGGRPILVTMATKRAEFNGYYNFKGCEKCAIHNRLLRRQYRIASRIAARRYVKVAHMWLLILTDGFVLLLIMFCYYNGIALPEKRGKGFVFVEKKGQKLILARWRRNLKPTTTSSCYYV